MNQEAFDKQQLIDYRLGRAWETLHDAQLLIEQGGSPGSVVNRSYYAMFYATLALLTKLGKGSSKHSGVIALFDQFLVKTGEFPRAMSKALHKAYDLRQIGDYRELIELDSELVQDILLSADQFVNNAETYLST